MQGKDRVQGTLSLLVEVWLLRLKLNLFLELLHTKIHDPWGKQKGSTRILTDTPVKAAIEDDDKKRSFIKNKKESMQSKPVL